MQNPATSKWTSYRIFDNYCTVHILLVQMIPTFHSGSERACVSFAPSKHRARRPSLAFAAHTNTPPPLCFHYLYYSNKGEGRIGIEHAFVHIKMEIYLSASRSNLPSIHPHCPIPWNWVETHVHQGTLQSIYHQVHCTTGTTVMLLCFIEL